MSKITSDITPALASSNTATSLPATPIAITRSKRKPNSPLESLNKLSKEDMAGENDLPPDLPTVRLCEDDIQKVAESVQKLIQPDIDEKIKKSIKDAIDAMKMEYEDKITDLTRRNALLSYKVSDLEYKAAHLEDEADNIEQYSRRNSLRISGEPYVEGENLVTKIDEITSLANIKLEKHQIDRVHRIGKKQDIIIVKFVNHWLKDEILGAKKKIHANKESIFISEDLTQKRSELLYKCRQLRDAEKILYCYSGNGNIIIRDNNNRKKKIHHPRELDTYM